MNTFALLVIADALFLIVTVCVVLLTVVFAMAGISLIKLVRSARRVSRNVRMFQLLIKNIISKF